MARGGSVPVIAAKILRNPNPPVAAQPFNPAPLMIPALPVFQRDDQPSVADGAPSSAPQPNALPAYTRSAIEKANQQLTQAQPSLPQAVAVPDWQQRPLGRFPKINEMGYEAKRTPVLGQVFGGVADFATNVGTPRLSAQNAAAASWDLAPWMKIAKFVKPIAPAINAMPTAKQWGIDAALSFLPNPFEESVK